MEHFVKVEIVRFLSACEDGGVELLECWPTYENGCSAGKTKER
jgi:hypothetical protein